MKLIIFVHILAHWSFAIHHCSLNENLTDGQIALESRTNSNNSGNVLIFQNGRLWSVCDDGWNMHSARVVCKYLGFSDALKATTQSFYGTTKYDIGLDNVQCYGDETDLMSCRHEPFGRHNCNKKEAAGVLCSTATPTPTTTYIPTTRRTSPPPLFQLIRRERTQASSSNGTENSNSSDNGDRASEQNNGGNFQSIRNLRRTAAHSGRHNPLDYEVRIMNGRKVKEGRVEVKIDGQWGIICGDDWTLMEAGVVCRQLGLDYAYSAPQSSYFGGENMTKFFKGIKCDGDEDKLHECYHEQAGDDVLCSRVNRVAGVMCTSQLPDLVPNATLIENTVYLHDQPMYYLRCALEENCAAPSAFEIKKTRYDWHIHRRRLLRFSSSIWNLGTADFRPELRKQDWEWHLCHMHYHSMSVFAHYDILDVHGNRVAEGHKASFCLEDVRCKTNVSHKYACKGFGDQGISVGCADDYLHDIDCQWIDITDVQPGDYILKVHVNPNYIIAELDFNNNAVTCNIRYTGSELRASSCMLGRG